MNTEILATFIRKDGTLLYSKNDFFKCEACALIGGCAFAALLFPLTSAMGLMTERILSACFLLGIAFAHWITGLIFTNNRVRRAAGILEQIIPLDHTAKIQLLRGALAFKGCFSGSKLMDAIRKAGYDAPEDMGVARVMFELAQLERARLLYWLGLPFILLLPITFFLAG